MAFFNTTSESDQTLQVFDTLADNQDAITLRFYKIKKVGMTPCEVHASLINMKLLPDNTPITSIRRSITSLTNKGLLIKMEAKITGIYGRPAHCWKINSTVVEHRFIGIK